MAVQAAHVQRGHPSPTADPRVREALRLMAAGQLPLNLLPASFNALLGLPMLVALAFLASRAVGAAIRVNPWTVFLSGLLLNFLAICSFGCCVGLLFAVILH